MATNSNNSVWERRKIDEPMSDMNMMRSSIKDRDRRRILYQEKERWGGSNVNGSGNGIGIHSHVDDKFGATSSDDPYTYPLQMDMERRSHYDDPHAPPPLASDDRDDLLRQIDMLKDKLSRSGNLIERGKAKVPQENINRMAFPDEDRNRMMMQNPYPHQTRFQNQWVESSPAMYAQDPYDYDYAPNHVHSRYGAPLRPQNHTRDPRQPPTVYRSRSYQDEMAPPPHPSTFNRHHPSCSCYQCLNQRQVPDPIPYRDKYSSDMEAGYHDNNPGSFVSRDYYYHHNRGFSDNNLPLRPGNSSSHDRWPSDVDSEAMVGYTNRSPRRVRVGSGGKPCRPVAGGAPFFICSNCSELLLLSIKVVARNKVRCGACATLVVVTISNRRLVVSSSTDLPAKDATDADNNLDLKLKFGTDYRNQENTTFSSDGYDNSGYDYHYMDREIRRQGSAGKESDRNSMEGKTHQPASPRASEADDDDQETLASAAATKYSSSKDSKGASPHAASSLHHDLGHSDKYNAASRSEDGDLDKHSKHEEVVSVLPKKTTPPLISRKDSSATEIDLSSNEFNNTGTTLDSGEASRGRDNLKASRMANSFFAGIVEENFKDSERSGESVEQEQEKANVTVNGHLIPNRLISKAQKLAGTILPGNYWYDFRAGFWGVIGGPCLGIIPPFIEEFNYPMDEHCSGGNTNVFVNGRELNQRDLNLLGSRGLPKERDRSYIVEISGRVVDDHTGEELESLGKLAPTVERMKRGFGMKPPKSAP